MDMIDGVEPLAAAEDDPAEHGVGSVARSSSSLSVDSVSVSNKRKAAATLPGNEEKSHRKSL